MGNKITGRDYPLSETPEPKGAYVTLGSKVGRTTPIYKGSVEYQSMDTSGYSNGKKNFTLTKSTPLQTSSSNVSRKDVSSTIDKFKKGATGVITNKK